MFSARLFIAFVTSLFGLVAVNPAAAQDAVTATPEIYKVLLDNSQIRVLEINYQPGQGENWHGHPRYLVYVVEPGKLQVENDKGEFQEFELQLGQNVLTGPVTKHHGKNIGNVPIRILAIELKQQ